MQKQENNIIIYQDEDGVTKVSVKFSDEDIWLTQNQIAEIYKTTQQNISLHINNIYRDNELEKNSTNKEFLLVQNEGNRNVKRNIDHYNLDMIISVGYRVKSQNGVIFRKWANKILKDYMLKGYAVNQKRLEYLEKTIKLIDIANRIDERLEGNDAKEILKVIGGYSKALDLLDDYDHRTLKKIEGNVDDRKIEYQECINIINKLRFNEESSLFADGNKRIAATLFIYFLNFYGILYKNGKKVIDNNTLTALTLLIAESNPKEKDVIVDLVMNFLNNE